MTGFVLLIVCIGIGAGMIVRPYVDRLSRAMQESPEGWL